MVTDFYKSSFAPAYGAVLCISNTGVLFIQTPKTLTALEEHNVP